MGTLLVAVAFFGLLALGMPVGFSIGVAGVIGILDMGPRFLTMAPDRVFAGLDLFPFLAMPFFILGSILGGFATPTGAAAIAAAYALFVGGVIHRGLTRRDLYEIAVRTTRITGVIFLIIASASILGWWMTFNRIPQEIAQAMLSVSDDPQVIIGLILILFLLIGLVMDINATLIVLAPVLAPRPRATDPADRH